MISPQWPAITGVDWMKTGVTDMAAIRSGYRSLSLLADLNWDRLLYGATIAFALSAGSVFGSFLH